MGRHHGTLEPLRLIIQYAGNPIPPASLTLFFAMIRSLIYAVALAAVLWSIASLAAMLSPGPGDAEVRGEARAVAW
jgi:hypothetical protein